MTAISTSTSSDIRPERYNSGMIWLHWATALLVIALFLSAQVWDFAEKGGALRSGLKSVHYGCGILLALAFFIRISWRFANRDQLPEDEKGLSGLLAKLVHGLLYLALAAQVVLGFAWRWSQGKAVDFFGTFQIADPIGIPPDLRHTLGELHETVAYILVAMACIHAIAAIFHHVVLKDGVLLKMMPKPASR
jgi:cytochrome b561